MNNKIRILAIDDSEDILFAVNAICEYQGWEAFTASQALDGVEILKSRGADLILIDYHMPKVNGIETVKLLRNIDKAIPIIVLTVEERTEIADQFMAAGANDFALKPVKALDLIWRIKTHLRITQTSNSTVSEDYEYVKGISNETLNIILSCMKRINDGLTIEQISQESGLAYQTVHRYMQYLIKSNKAEMTSTYGKQGRPTNIYSIKH